jgi:hypothetical protein
VDLLKIRPAYTLVFSLKVANMYFATDFPPYCMCSADIPNISEVFPRFISLIADAMSSNDIVIVEFELWSVICSIRRKSKSTFFIEVSVSSPARKE